MPRATSKGESPNSIEMVDRFSLANGTAVQIHWPSAIAASEHVDLQSWLQLMTAKIIARVAVPAGTPPAPMDWKEQRDRTREALNDRIVEVGKTDASAWSFPPGTEVHFGSDHIAEVPRTDTGLYVQAMDTARQAFQMPIVDDPPPSELRQYFAGCQCEPCKENYRVPGTQYVDESMPGYEAHMQSLGSHELPPPVPEVPRFVAPTLYYQGCKCDRCRANRATGQLVWGGSAEHSIHLAEVAKSEDLF